MLIQTHRNGHTKQTHAHNKDKYREHRYTYIKNIKVENYKICFNDSGFVCFVCEYNTFYIWESKKNFTKYIIINNILTPPRTGLDLYFKSNYTYPWLIGLL
jgi:hypothetical protein